MHGDFADPACNFSFVLFIFLKLMEIVETLMHLGLYCKIWRDDIFSVQTLHSVISLRDLSLSDTAINPIGIWSLAPDVWSSYHEAFCVIISWTRTISWNIKHFAKPVGSTANKSPPDTSCHIASFLFFSKIRNQGEPTKYRKLVMMLPSPLNRFFPHYFDWRVLIKMTIPCQSEALFIHKWVLLPHTTAFCSPHSLLPNQNSPEMNGNANTGWQNICIYYNDIRQNNFSNILWWDCWKTRWYLRNLRQGFCRPMCQDCLIIIIIIIITFIYPQLGLKLKALVVMTTQIHVN